jgi:hypothetical protein
MCEHARVFTRSEGNKKPHALLSKPKTNQPGAFRAAIAIFALLTE